MGIESDQVVYEYLSRVGDIAQQRQLPSATRMRLVSELRNEIDRHRAKVTVDSPAAVRRILDRLGTPDEVVAAAGGTPGPPSAMGTPGPTGITRPTGASRAPSTAVPAQPAPAERERKPKPERPDLLKGLRRVVPRPRPAEPDPPAVRPDAPSPPHLAAAHELGDSVTQPDWWRVESGSPLGFGTAGDAVPGFVGGVEIPELLRRPQKETKAAEERPADGMEKSPDPVPAAQPDPAASSPRRLSPGRLLPRPAAGWTNPLLLLAAAALLAGAVLGKWFALGLGWLIAWGSRRLTPAETKWAVVILPGLSVTAGLVWLWGRNTGRWGAPIAQGHMGDALAGTWPWMVRGAAVASALFLLWRSQRRR
ncbi:hypothetical protein [Streptomyces sp. NK08204]|uniref:hypothetical protein n=1 Tax=Streptomyces sp. NK08204 TaxID=2873260 RepID=UPI001CEDED88|nr:hypothetical protein [Streptomyces sp. NK08204]